MKIDFSGIIQMFQMEGFVALGKIKHPASDAIEKNLDHASFVIDLMSVLEEKTRGNLSDQEQRLMQYALQDLKLNFVSESDSAISSPSNPTT